MAKKRVLVVDDELNIRRILQAAFDKAGWQTQIAESGEEALQMAGSIDFDCILTDATMPGMTGYDLQKKLADMNADLPVVIMTAYGSIPQAVDAIRNGAYEFVTKPFDLDSLKKVIASAMEGESKTKTRAKKTKKAAKPKAEFIAASPSMQEIYETVKQVADSRATVLITGESGTGKEVVSKLIHQLSPRAEQPFVAVSCAAIPETLLESELFGHEKGAFTGADAARAGRFELADTGTLFLDEVGDIPLPVQVKLLRVLQEREFERLGATQPTKVDVRLVTATNRDLQQAVDDGEFRLDLLYRLQVVEIALPALRNRIEDIEPLALHFLGRHAAENDRCLFEISGDALSALQSYSWPGNVRELENAMERAVVLAGRDETTLLPRHLPPKMRAAA